MVLSTKRETVLNAGPVPSANAWLRQWLRGRGGFHVMKLYRDTVGADTDHALLISLSASGLCFLPSQSIRNHDTEQDTRYLLRMRSGG